MADPCGVLSIPLWKWKRIVIPEGMKIVHDSVFSLEEQDGFADERYFRLHRTFENPGSFRLDEYEIRTAAEEDFSLMADVINRSYSELQVSVPQLMGYTQTPVYRKDLWILICEKESGKCVGSGIADFDAETGELILEWIQVLPEYRRQKIGQAIVCELLRRAKDYASFATVSGKMDDPVNPEALYRACGFAGNDVWHIMNKL